MSVVVCERKAVTLGTTEGHSADVHHRQLWETLGGIGFKAGCHQTGGVRGEWSVVRPRRRKAPEQVEERWDRVREDQRQGGSRKQRYMQSRVRVRSASTSQYRFPEGQQFYSDQDSFYDYFSSYDHHHFFRDWSKDMILYSDVAQCNVLFLLKR